MNRGKIAKSEPTTTTCHDCGAEEGQLHKFGCDMERCPFCSKQLISCGCCYEILGLRDPARYSSRTAHLPPEIYTGGLSKEQEWRWLFILNERGRIPWIQYPVICAKCGELWPDFFSVPDEEWEKYVRPGVRVKVLCKLCYDYIKGVIDANKIE